MPHDETLKVVRSESEGRVTLSVSNGDRTLASKSFFPGDLTAAEILEVEAEFALMARAPALLQERDEARLRVACLETDVAALNAECVETQKREREAVAALEKVKGETNPP
jgi:hypothetical protein